MTCLQPAHAARAFSTLRTPAFLGTLAPSEQNRNEGSNELSSKQQNVWGRGGGGGVLHTIMRAVGNLRSPNSG